MKAIFIVIFTLLVNKPALADNIESRFNSIISEIEKSVPNTERGAPTLACSGGTSCQDFITNIGDPWANGLQVQVWGNNIDIYSAGKTDPNFVHAACSAAYIAITGANPDLVKSQFRDFMSVARQSGKSEWESQEAEIEFEKNSEDNIDCSIFKRM